MTSMFTCITLEEWPETMYATVNSEFRASAAYYITLIIVGTYFIVSVFVAAVSGVFLRLRREHVAMLKHRNAQERSPTMSNEEEEEEFAKGFARFTRLKTLCVSLSTTTKEERRKMHLSILPRQHSRKSSIKDVA